MIVQYTDEYRENFLNLIRNMWHDRKTCDETSYEYLDCYWYEDNILNNDGFILLLNKYINDTIDAFMLAKVNKSVVEILMLYVQPNSRRMGIAEELKKAMTQTAKEIGAVEIKAYNLWSNKESFNLNKKLGWEIEWSSEYHYKSFIKFNQEIEI